MKERYLEYIQCPVCRSFLDVQRKIDGAEGQLEWALLRCRCNTLYPILDGILLLGSPTDPRRHEAVSVLECESPRRFHAWLAEAMKRWAPELPIPPAREFGFDAMVAAGGGLFYEYLAYRWASRSYCTGIALIGAAKSGLCVDVGCGLGHLTFSRSSQYPKQPIIALEYCFNLLYVGKRFGFLSSEVACVCADADVGLPVIRERASLVIISDGLHYFRKQEYLLQETIHSLAGSGVLALNHVHNAEAATLEPAQGLSRPVSDYVDLLQNAGFSRLALFGDEGIISSRLAGRCLSEETCLRTASSVSFLASKGMLELGSADSDCHRSADILSLNPIFRTGCGSPGAVHLVWPSQYFRSEHSSCLFPMIVDMSKEAMDRRQLELRRRLILVESPSGFLPSTPWAQ